MFSPDPGWDGKNLRAQGSGTSGGKKPFESQEGRSPVFHDHHGKESSLVAKKNTSCWAGSRRNQRGVKGGGGTKNCVPALKTGDENTAVPYHDASFRQPGGRASGFKQPLGVAAVGG